MSRWQHRARGEETILDSCHKHKHIFPLIFLFGSVLWFIYYYFKLFQLLTSKVSNNSSTCFHTFELHFKVHLWPHNHFPSLRLNASSGRELKNSNYSLTLTTALILSSRLSEYKCAQMHMWSCTNTQKFTQTQGIMHYIPLMLWNPY